MADDPGGVIDLNGQNPIAKGGFRDVYTHPGRPDLLLKVIRTGAQTKTGRPIRNFLKARTQKQRLRGVYREINALLDAQIIPAEPRHTLPISRIHGLRQTTRGLAMVVEAVRVSDHDTPRSIGRIDKDGALTPAVVETLNAFIADIYACDVIVNDANPENIMLDGISRPARFVLVDGFGDASMLQLKRFSRRLRDRSRDRHFAALALRLGLDWVASDRLMVAKPG